MNEEIRKDEINEEALESVSGGAGVFAATKACPRCGMIMLANVGRKDGRLYVVGYNCSKCDYAE